MLYALGAFADNHLIKMIVITNLEHVTITNVVKEQVGKSAELITDDSTSYFKLDKYVKAHKAVVVKFELGLHLQINL